MPNKMWFYLYERETTPLLILIIRIGSLVVGKKLIDFSPNTLGDKFLSLILIVEF
jgi:hypothetical protein